MTAHHDEVELPVPRGCREVAEDPFDVGSGASLFEHPDRGVESAQPPGVALLPGPAQQGTGAAPDVEHRVGRHDEVEVEVVVTEALPRTERVVERGETRVGELVVDHDQRRPSCEWPSGAFSQTETCLRLSPVNGPRFQSPHRSRRVSPAIRAIRSSSDGHT